MKIIIITITISVLAFLKNQNAVKLLLVLIFIRVLKNTLLLFTFSCNLLSVEIGSDSW